MPSLKCCIVADASCVAGPKNTRTKLSRRVARDFGAGPDAPQMLDASLGMEARHYLSLLLFEDFRIFLRMFERCGSDHIHGSLGAYNGKYDKVSDARI